MASSCAKKLNAMASHRFDDLETTKLTFHALLATAEEMGAFLLRIRKLNKLMLPGNDLFTILGR